MTRTKETSLSAREAGRASEARIAAEKDSETVIAAVSLTPLFAWLSPSFPVGAYAYSHGLEWAVASGDVRDEGTLGDWLKDLLRYGAGRNDAILLVAALRSAAAREKTTLVEINALALALAPSKELHLETSQQGRSFLDAVLAGWGNPALTDLAAALDGPVAYPVAVGLAAGCHGIAAEVTARAFLLAFIHNLVSAAVRLAPIGQTGGVRVVAALAPAVEDVANQALKLTLEDLGGATFRADLGSFLHETQYTRLFRS